MELDVERLQNARDHFGVPGSSDEAPVEIVCAVFDLLDPTKIEASFVERDEQDGTTTWAGLWLTQAHVVRIEASRRMSRWNLVNQGEPDVHPPSVTAWRRPRTDIRALEIGSLNYSKGWSGKYEWSASYLLHVDGTAPIALPSLSTDVPSERESERLRTVVDALG